MADGSLDRALTAAIDNSAALDAWIWLVPLQPQEQEPAPLPDDRHDDDVADLLNEFSPPEADLDELLLEEPLLGLVMLQALARSGGLDFVAVIMARLDGGEYRDGGFGAVPASAAAVGGLEKQMFRAGGDGCAAEDCGGVTGCAICLEDFEDGEEVSVMPCARGHEFHPDCIAEWLGHSNMCPLCRHALPTATSVDT